MRIGDAKSSWSTPLPAAPQPPAFSQRTAGAAPPTCVSEGYCSYCGRCAEVGKPETELSE